MPKNKTVHNKRSVTEFDIALGQRIKFYRMASQMPQSKIAEYLDISLIQYMRYENGKNRLNVEKLKKISEFLSISPNILIYEAEKHHDNVRYCRQYEDLLAYWHQIDDKEKSRILGIMKTLIQKS